jgi:hypothetical protein
MGGYGIIRICYPICPDAGFDLAWVVVGIGVVPGRELRAGSRRAPKT